MCTSQALSIYLSPETSAEFGMLIWCFPDHKHSLEHQCLLIPAYALWFPLCKLYMILRIPYQYLPILQHVCNSCFALHQGYSFFFSILWIFSDAVHISRSFIWTCLLTLVSGYNIYGLWVYFQDCFGRRKTRSQLHLTQDMTPFGGENKLEHPAKSASARAGSWETKVCQHAAGISLEHPSCHGQSQGDTTCLP